MVVVFRAPGLLIAASQRALSASALLNSYSPASVWTDIFPWDSWT
jgi:hypothetical protein